METEKLRISILAGPTAVGKTAYAIDLAQELETEIVSADSMQVYRHFNIGTAKPSAEERSRVPYHLLDCIDPREEFNLARFITLADETIADISQRGMIPLVVGGTGLYIKGLIEGIFEEGARDAEIRARLGTEIRAQGLGALYSRLEKVDPVAARRIDVNDKMRIVRALEVFELTGRPISELQKESRSQGKRYEYRLAILTRNREELYARIEARVDRMFAEGFVEEVRQLLDMGYSPESHAMKALGYREVVDYVKGKISLKEAQVRVKHVTRRYAKRQLTWFRGMPEAAWLNLSENTYKENLQKIREMVVFYK
jgi:tRNA dimethylallyltransferase